MMGEWAAGKRAAPAGSVVRMGSDGRPKRVESKGKRWTEESEARFLGALAGSANVRASARACGFNFATVYKQRAARGDFAAKWQVALEQGVARLEMALIRAAADTMEGLGLEPDSPFPRMSVGEAITVLKYHAAATGRNGRPARNAPRRRTVEELKDSLLRKAAAIRAARARGELAGIEASGDARADGDAGADGDAALLAALNRAAADADAETAALVAGAEGAGA